LTTDTISDELISWAQKAGYASTLDGNSVIFWSYPGGEIRLRVSVGSNSVYELWRTDRGGAEQEILSAPSIAPVDRYLWRYFGTEIRGRAKLSRLRFPVEADAVASGYKIDIADDDVAHLRDSLNEIVATGFGGSAGVMALVPLSYLLAARPDEVAAAFESSSGEPLFPLAR